MVTQSTQYSLPVLTVSKEDAEKESELYILKQRVSAHLALLENLTLSEQNEVIKSILTEVVKRRERIAQAAESEANKQKLAINNLLNGLCYERD